MLSLIRTYSKECRAPIRAVLVLQVKKTLICALDITLRGRAKYEII